MVMRSGLQGGKGRSNTAASGPSAFVAPDLSDTLTAFCYPLMSEGKQAHRTEVNLLFEGHWFGISSVIVAPALRLEFRELWPSIQVSVSCRDEFGDFTTKKGGGCVRCERHVKHTTGQSSSRGPAAQGELK